MMENLMKLLNIPEGTSIEERREIERKQLTKPISVTFSIEHEGEITDITSEGIGIKFHPLGTEALNVGRRIRLHLNMSDRIVSLQGEIRRISEKFGHIILGLSYDRDEVATFNLSPSDKIDSHEQDQELPNR